jgi:hypothetical protein
MPNLVLFVPGEALLVTAKGVYGFGLLVTDIVMQQKTIEMLPGGAAGDFTAR